MRRRALVTMLGGAVAAGPPAVLAQSPPKVYRVGLLSATVAVANDSLLGAPLIRGLGQLGYVEGRNIAFERRGAEGHIDRLPGQVDNLVASKVDVIVTFGYFSSIAAKQQQSTPVVV